MWCLCQQLALLVLLHPIGTETEHMCRPALDEKRPLVQLNGNTTTLGIENQIHLAFVRMPDKCGSPGTWKQGYQCCQSEGLTLPGISSREDNEKIVEIMTNKSFHSIWLAIKRIPLEHWTWVDGTLLVPKGNMGTGKCGVLIATTKVIQAAECSSMHFQLICEVKGCEGCASLGHFAQMCHKIGQHCLVVLYGHESWYNARSVCRSNDWDLLVLDHRYNLETLPLNANKTFWIGLRQEEWGFKPNGITVPRTSHWGLNEPRLGVNCTTFHVTRDSFEWRTSSCEDRSNILCVYDLAPKGTTVLPVSNIPESSKQPPSSEDQGRKIIWGLIAAIIVVVVVIASSTLVFVIIRNRRRNIQKRDSDEEECMLPPDRSKQVEKLQRNIAEAITKHYSKINSWYWEEELSPAAMDELYTEQAFTKVTKSGIKTTRTTFSGYTEIFPKDANSTFTYLEGAAGTGKTTLCRKILADWALQISTSKYQTTKDIYVGRFKFVLPIFLRNVKKYDDILSAVQRQLSLSGADKVLMEQLLYSEPKQFLFILDGYDEYSEDMSTEITSLAKWTIYPGVSVLMTSRYSPYEHFAISNFPDINHIILKGYLQESITCYLKKFLSSEEDCNLLQHQLSGSGLRNIAGNPSVLFLICILWKHTKKLPSTTTTFFKELTQYVCGRYEYKINKMPQQANIIETYHANLMEICEIAAEGSLATPMALYFDRSSTKKRMKKDGSWNLGFFVAEHGPESEGHVRFPHRTYQDFLAAYYILHLENDKERKKIYMKLLKSPESVKKWKWILSHLLGLGNEPVLDAFKDQIQGEIPMVETTVHLLFLSEHPLIPCPLPRIIDVCSRDYCDFDISAFFCQNGQNVEQIIFRASRIAQIWPIELLHAPNLKSLHVDHSMEYGPSGDVTKEVDRLDTLNNLEKLSVRGIQNMDDRDQGILSKIIKNNQSLKTFEYTDSGFVPMKRFLQDLTKRNILEIRLRNNSISDEDMHLLFEHLSSWPLLRVLDLFGNTAMVKSFKGLSENLFYLQELRVCTCQLEAIDECFATFESTHSLRVIDLRGEEKRRRGMKPDVTQNIPDKSDEYRKLSRALARANQIEELRLKTSKYLDAIEPLLDCFQSMYKLEILDVAKTIATRPIYEKFGKALPRMKRMRELRLCDCLYRDKGAGLSLVKSLPSMTGLRILELGHHSLNEEALTELSKNLQHFPDLRELLMYYTDACDFANGDIGRRRLFEEAWSRLLSKIDRCKSLRILDLKGNRIGNESVSQLTNQISKLRDLEILMLDHCHLDKVAPIMELFSKLSECPVLKELDLSNNILGKHLTQLSHRDIHFDPHTKVNLSNNGIPEEEKDTLRSLFMRESNVTL